MGYNLSDVSHSVTQQPDFTPIQTAFCKATALQPRGSKQCITDPYLFFACLNHVAVSHPESDWVSHFGEVPFDTVRSNFHVRVEPKKSWAYFYIGPILDFSANPATKEKLDKIIVEAVAMYMMAVEKLNDYFDTDARQLTSSFKNNYPDAKVPSVKQLIHLVKTMD